MNTPVKLGGFGALLVAVLAVSFGIGNIVGPVGQDTETHSSGHGSTDSANDGAAMPEGHEMEAAPSSDSIPGGLMVSQSGYTLDLATPVAAPGTTAVEFRITRPDNTALTEFDTQHDKKLHLIAIRRDTTGFQHVHPVMADDGTWTTDLALVPGDWRLFADFKPTGADNGITLGTDAHVAGAYDPEPLPAESRTAEVDGYTVTLAGDLDPGGSSELTLSVAKDGAPVTDLQPYLGAYGHLVAIRNGDLAYLHVHPDGEPGDGTTEPGPEVTFFATVPSGGWYRLFLDFKHDGVVRTAEFTVPAEQAEPASEPAPGAAATTTAPYGHSGH
jgi:hypothetical protein